MILLSRFTAASASIIAALMLSACQPKPDNDANASTDTGTNTEIAESAVTPAAVETDDAQTQSNDSVAASETHSAIDVVQMNEDYSKAMTRMNDEMMIGMAYNDPDTAFAKSMLGLHRGAVSMTELQLKYGTDSEMRLLAQEMMTAQQQNIGIINKWLASHPDSAKPKPNTEAMQRSYANIVTSMNYKIRLGTDTSLGDMAFARGTLPHQIAAVDMAKIQLRYGTDEDMRRLAVQLVNNQQAIIERLRAWLVANGTTEQDNDFADYELEEGDLEQDDKLAYESESVTAS